MLKTRKQESQDRQIEWNLPKMIAQPVQESVGCTHEIPNKQKHATTETSSLRHEE